MDKQTFSTLCKYFNLVHSVTLRAIDAFVDRDLDFRPNPDMRTPRELIFHVYCQEKILAEAAQDGRMSTEAASRSVRNNRQAQPRSRPLSRSTI